MRTPAGERRGRGLFADGNAQLIEPATGTHKSSPFSRGKDLIMPFANFPPFVLYVLYVLYGKRWSLPLCVIAPVDRPQYMPAS